MLVTQTLLDLENLFRYNFWYNSFQKVFPKLMIIERAENKYENFPYSCEIQLQRHYRYKTDAVNYKRESKKLSNLI